MTYGDLIGPTTLTIDLELAKRTNPFSASLVENTPLQSYKKINAVGKPIPRRDVPMKVGGTFEYVHNVRLQACCTAG